MAVMATDNKEFHAAEEAYAAVGRFDIVDYIRYIKVKKFTLYTIYFIYKFTLYIIIYFIWLNLLK